MTLRVETSGSKFDNSAIPEAMQDHRLSQIVHEFSNALFVARGYVRLLLEKKETALSQTDKRQLTAVSYNMDRLVSLVRDLNALRAPASPALAQPFIPESTRNILSGLRPVVNHKKLTLRENLTCNPMPNAGLPQRALPPLREFLSAAVEMAAERGTFDISARKINGRICLQAVATGVQPKPGAIRDVSQTVRLWRSLGGRVRIVSSDSRYSVLCDFPSERSREC